MTDSDISQGLKDIDEFMEQEARVLTYYEEFEEIKSLGSRTNVVKYRNSPYTRGQTFVSQKFPLSLLQETENDEIIQKAERIRQMQHQNLVSYEKVYFQEGVELILIMEYCRCDSLQTQIDSNKANKKL